ncbi:unnamed protein product [Rodentolepis nana]|uniref:Uncharacterized protein n=1 Tax=Rodentolepis nana TaxID=102285 RepID=A0A158QJI4_RODNA|nr:unnamed protein product [Rodentolepis nana]
MPSAPWVDDEDVAPKFVAEEAELSRPGRRTVKEGHLREPVPEEDFCGSACSRESWLRRVGSSDAEAGDMA